MYSFVHPERGLRPTPHLEHLYAGLQALLLDLGDEAVEEETLLRQLGHVILQPLQDLLLLVLQSPQKDLLLLLQELMKLLKLVNDELPAVLDLSLKREGTNYENARPPNEVDQ